MCPNNLVANLNRMNGGKMTLKEMLLLLQILEKNKVQEMRLSFTIPDDWSPSDILDIQSQLQRAGFAFYLTSSAHASIEILVVRKVNDGNA